MRAVIFDRYGAPDVLRLDDVERPVPKDYEVLVKVHATTVNRTDCGYRRGDGFITRLGYSVVTTRSPCKALWHPQQRVPGMELAGEVAAVGAAVREFQVGDRVFGVNPGTFAANAEFTCIRERAPVARMPAQMPFEEAVAVDGAMLALGCLRRAHLRKGQRILIYGASGSIGTAGVQLARYFGAHVTAVCNTKNVETVRAQGAHRGGEVPSSDRSLLPTRRRDRGDQVRGNGAEDRERRPDRPWPSSMRATVREQILHDLPARAGERTEKLIQPERPILLRASQLHIA